MFVTREKHEETKSH